ncbi:hypothetical protein [Falsiroseomonas sp.]|uniref:hypothetical protein n=1 Tax=Falsiroseomonas sp. TaxID=2870721 RepID=UPI003F704F22
MPDREQVRREGVLDAVAVLLGPIGKPRRPVPGSACNPRSGFADVASRRCISRRAPFVIRAAILA